MTTKNNKKNNSARKIIPAAGMLMVSALMLSTSTYAWFTMSREVEVKNISMTATVPEDIQISLGTLGSANNAAATKAGDGYTLAGSTGVLVRAGDSGTADNCNVKAPTNDWDWSNTADISAYYKMGELIPASSTTGANIYFTPDANGVGKTVKSDARYIKANGDTPGGTAVSESGDGAGEGTYAAKLYAFTDPDSKTWGDYDASNNATGYRKSTAYNCTYDDGYYVDIPVWLRTSSTAGASLKVEAYVIPNNSAIRENGDGEALYRAVRVALLDPGSQVGDNVVTPTGLLPVADGWEGMSTSAYGNIIDGTPFGGTSVLTWYNGGADKTTASNNVAVKANGTLDDGRFDSDIYGPATVYNPASAVAVSLDAGSGNEYGDAAKVIIRVWLEGEDTDCWNDTAGQGWSINLKFVNGDVTGGDDISGTAGATVTKTTGAKAAIVTAANAIPDGATEIKVDGTACADKAAAIVAAEAIDDDLTTHTLTYIPAAS